MSTQRTTQLLTDLLPGGRPPSTSASARRRLLWAGTVIVGLLSWLAVWSAQALLVQGANAAFLGLQGSIYDQGMTRFARETARGQKSAGDVVVVAIKESTLRDLAGIPSFVPGVPGVLNFREHGRAFHARLLRNLKALGAGPVVFDIVFDSDNEKLDPFFAQQIKAYGKVVFAAVPEVSTESSGQGTVQTLVLPNPTLLEPASGIGIAAVALDTDKTLRKFVWWGKGIDPITVEDRNYPALGAAAAAVFKGMDLNTLVDNELRAKSAFGDRRIAWSDYEDKADAKDIRKISYMRYFGELGSPSGPGSVINFENLVRSGQDDEALLRLREQVKGKIILVGDETQLGQDYHRVPVISNIKGLGEGQQMPGVEIHAHIAQTVLKGTYPTIAPWMVNLLATLVVCMSIAVLGKILPPAPLIGTLLVVIFGLYQLSIWIFSGPSAVFWEPITAMAGAGVAGGLELGFMFVVERRQRQAVRRVLDRHVGVGVAGRLADDEWPEGKGETREITMLFSDLQGFTTLSETMTSQEICALLNRYFGIILPILFEHGGTLDKLMGDGMMAYFGWPQRTERPADRSIECAVRMLEALDEWQRQPENAGMPPLRTRIGIHTGSATVGEIGGAGRAEFTVIGDVVNVASRLEGMNKDYGTQILVSQDTKDQVGNLKPMTYRGVATVRGRTEPMPVYSIDSAPSTARQRTITRGGSRTGSATQSRTEPHDTAPQDRPGDGNTERLG